MADDLWYALQVRPRRESMIAEILSNKGYEPFLPTYNVKRRWSDRTKILTLPLFSGYLFCRFDVETRLPILQTPGVTSIVGIGRNPRAIDEAEIEAIRRVINSGVRGNPYPDLPVGQRVRIESGALEGLVGVVQKHKNE